MNEAAIPAADIVLYDAANMPSPRRVRMCLIEKGLSFRIRWLNLGLMDQKQPAYLRLNPTGLVPTLLHEGQRVYDSNVINEYLDSLYPQPPLVPPDAFGQAQMRMWFAFEGDFAKPFRDASYETLGKARVRNTGMTPQGLSAEIGKRTSKPAYLKFVMSLLTMPTDESLIADRLALILEKLSGMEDSLADGRTWLCGDCFTLADIALAPRMDMFPVIGVHDLPERFYHIGAWMRRLQQRQSWQRSLITPAPGETERFVAI